MVQISEIEDNSVESAKLLKEMSKEIDKIRLKNEDLEARSRRSNVRILGIAESTSNVRMENYVEKMFRQIFGADNLSNFLIVVRAH